MSTVSQAHGQLAAVGQELTTRQGELVACQQELQQKIGEFTKVAGELGALMGRFVSVSHNVANGDIPQVQAVIEGSNRSDATAGVGILNAGKVGITNTAATVEAARTAIENASGLAVSAVQQTGTAIGGVNAAQNTFQTYSGTI